MTSLDAATEVLLSTIERETGERPALDEDEEIPDAEDVAAALYARPQGWLKERTAVAIELLRATDLAQATVRSIARARLAILWSQEIDAQRSEVDEQLVRSALRRADELIGPIEGVEPQRSEVSLAHAPVTRFDWPVSPVQVTSRFGMRVDPFGQGARRHLGLDLAASEGQAVSSASDGVVRFAGKRGGYGLHVEIHHDDGYITRYAHLSKVLVVVGNRVSRGGAIGLAGKTGRAPGPHLHFELWRRGVAVDPVPLFPDDEASGWGQWGNAKGSPARMSER